VSLPIAALDLEFLDDAPPGKVLYLLDSTRMINALSIDLEREQKICG
jgi:hypothetical protein